MREADGGTLVSAIAGSEKFDAIQAARGAAALLVVFYHAERMTALPQYLGREAFDGFFGFGHAGVDFFFVLSGFIIFYVHGGDIGQPKQLGRYLWRRVTRIYPIYWIVTALVVLMTIIRPDEVALTMTHLVKSLLLIPEIADPVLGVAWTLSHEMLFYLLFAIAIANRRVGVIALLLWAVLVTANLLRPFSHAGLSFIASSHHIGFFLGIGAAYWTRNATTPAPRAILLIGVACFFATGLAENAGLFVKAGVVSQALFSLFAAAIVIGAAAAERAGSVKAGPIAVAGGAASYSIYLIHTIAIGLTAKALATLGILQHLPDALVFAIVVIASLAAAAVLYVAAEKPLLIRLQEYGRTRLFAPRAGRAARSTQ